MFNDMSLLAITKHINVLEKAGLITRTRQAQWRPCKLNAGLKDMVDWVEQCECSGAAFRPPDACLNTVTTNENEKGNEMNIQSNEISITRTFDSPVRTVWDAWTDPVQVAQWWGPRGFTLTTHSKDLRQGGNWRYTMHGPDGVDYPNHTVYLAVETGSKLVYDHGGSDDRPPLFRVTVMFTENEGGTRMDMRMTLPTPEAAEQTRQLIRAAGGNSTWDRLAEYLEKEASGKETFVINRSFDVPIVVMFEMWTDPKHVAQWLPPTGFQMEFIKADIRPGGDTMYVMRGGGLSFYARARYLELEQPGRIVYTQQFCDKDGNVARHPLAPTWPETMLTTVRLAEEGADRTRVTVTWEADGPTTREELDIFAQSRAGMTLGWTGSFDKLDAYLANR